MYAACGSHHPKFQQKYAAAGVFLDIEKDFDTTWHSGLLYRLSEWEFLKSLIKLIASFLNDRKFKFFSEDEFSTPRKIATGVPQASILAPILYSLHINDDPRHFESV
jgi:hypothetical protein